MASIAGATGIPRTTLRRRLSGEGQPILVDEVAAIANYLLTPITPIWNSFLLGARDERRSYPVCPWWCITKDHLVDHDGSACPCRPEATAGFRWSLLHLANPGWEPRRNSCSARGMTPQIWRLWP